MGHDEPYWGNDNVQKLDYEDGCKTYGIFKNLLNYILEMGEFYDTWHKIIIPQQSESSHIRENAM